MPNKTPPEDIVHKLKLLAEEYREKFKCEVFLADITTRKNQYQQDVKIINHDLNSLLAYRHIKNVKHSNIKSCMMTDIWEEIENILCWNYLQHQSQQQIHWRYTYRNNITCNHPCNNYQNQAPSYYYIIDLTNKVVILNDWKVKCKTMWGDVFIYKYVDNKYEHYVLFTTGRCVLLLLQ